MDYIYCNENVRKEWLPVAVEHLDRDISDHKAVVTTLLKKK